MNPKNITIMLLIDSLLVAFEAALFYGGNSITRPFALGGLVFSFCLFLVHLTDKILSDSRALRKLEQMHQRTEFLDHMFSDFQRRAQAEQGDHLKPVPMKPPENE